MPSFKDDSLPPLPEDEIIAVDKTIYASTYSAATPVEAPAATDIRSGHRKKHTSFFTDIEKQWNSSSTKYMRSFQPLEDTECIDEYLSENHRKPKNSSNDSLSFSVAAVGEMEQDAEDDGRLALAFTGDINLNEMKAANFAAAERQKAGTQIDHNNFNNVSRAVKKERRRGRVVISNWFQLQQQYEHYERVNYGNNGIIAASNREQGQKKYKNSNPITRLIRRLFRRPKQWEYQ